VPEQRGVEDDAAGQKQPEGERVQPRERHVPGADHQRDEVVAEAGHDRNDEQEDHRRAVQGEQLVVMLAADQRVVRDRELRAHQQSLDAAEDEEHERQDQVHDPDLLVVGGQHPIEPLLGLARLVDLVGEDLGYRTKRLFGSAHVALVRFLA
jgi:hypothetical protein